MIIDCLRDGLSVRVTESLLTQFLGCSETVHQSCIRMTEGVEAIAAGRLNTYASPLTNHRDYGGYLRPIN